MGPKRHDRGNGRIFKVSYGDKAAPAADLAKLSSEELMKLQLADNSFLAHTARRLLQERGQETAKKTPKVPEEWAQALAAGGDEVAALIQDWLAAKGLWS